MTRTTLEFAMHSFEGRLRQLQRAETSPHTNVSTDHGSYGYSGRYIVILGGYTWSTSEYNGATSYNHTTTIIDSTTRPPHHAPASGPGGANEDLKTNWLVN
jgi:hypothetical protein